MSVKKNYNLSLLAVFAVNILCNISASILYTLLYILLSNKACTTWVLSSVKCRGAAVGLISAMHLALRNDPQN